MRDAMRLIVLITCAALALTSCNGDEQTNSDDLPEARPLLEESADQIQNASSLDVELDVDGYPVELEAQDLDALPADIPLYFKYAKGVYQAPDRLEATIQFGVGELSTTADLVALDRNHFLRGDLLTANRWVNAELIPGFSPASLMARPGGIAYALLSITDLEIVGEEDIEGLHVFRLRGTVEASAVHALTFGLIRSKHGFLKIEVYIEVGERRVAMIKLVDPSPVDVEDAEDTTWMISILDYNRDVSITPPPLGEE